MAFFPSPPTDRNNQSTAVRALRHACENLKKKSVAPSHNHGNITANQNTSLRDWPL
jgi:hypothetical protein